MKSALRNIFILLLIAATLAVIYWLVISYYDEKNRTDDAQVDGNIVPVLARTDGFVDTIFADDDQYIDAGKILVQLDTTDLHLQLQQALTALEVSHTNVTRSQVGIHVAELDHKIAAQNIEAQKVSLTTSQSNYERNKVLQEKGVVSRQIYEMTEESYKKNGIALEQAYDRQTQSAAKVEDARKQLELANQNIAAQLNQIAIDYYGLKTGHVVSVSSYLDLKKELAAGHPIITGMAGKLLPNPYFSNGGPNYHMLVVKGYDATGFLTNEPGTYRGNGYHYDYGIFFTALHDWNAQNILQGAKEYLVFK